MNQDDFNQLRDEWYAKLKATGFRDIESWDLRENGDLEPNFLVDHMGRGKAVAKQGAETQAEDLFVVLGRHYHATRFRSFKHRVWALLYVNGWRGAEISRLVGNASPTTINTYLATFRAKVLEAGLQKDTEGAAE